MIDATPFVFRRRPESSFSDGAAGPRPAPGNAVSIPRSLQHVAQDRIAPERQDRLRMELQARLLRLRIADRHRHPFDLGMDLEARREVARTEAVVAANA